MRITEIHLTPLFVPYSQEFRWAHGSISGASVVLIEMATDDNIIGYGECIGSRNNSGVIGFLQEAKSLLINKDPFDNAHWIEDITHQIFQSDGTLSTPRFANRILAGLEMAMWDIVGKAVNKPMHALLGGAVRDSISYFGFPQGDTPQAIASHAKSLAESGFRVIYVKVGRGDDVDYQIIRQVRDAIGPNIRLRVDPNENWNGLRLSRMVNRIQGFNLEFIEQPTKAEAPAALTDTPGSSGIPIAADQSVFTQYDVFNIGCRGGINMVVLGVHETGGVLNFIAASNVAHAAGIDICIHGLYETGITMCANHQAGLVMKNLDDGNQYMRSLLEWDLIESSQIVLKRGEVPALKGPGLGFVLNRDAVERAARLYRTLHKEDI